MSLKSLCFLLAASFFSSLSMALDTPSMTLNKLSQNQGFFFFYSASCQHCQRFAPTLKDFSTQYGFKVVAISVDGGFLTPFPDAVVDEGQKDIFGVNVLPALFLVNPGDQKAALVNEGNIDRAELEQRMLKIASLLEQESLQ